MTRPGPRTLLPPGAIPSLDGVRALAVTLVFLSHSGLGDLVPGGLGVTIFFVLSGYLITTLTRIEVAATGRLAGANFYLRRALRLMPPLLIVVATAGVLAGVGAIDGAFTPGGLLAALFYGGNYFVIAQDFHGMPAGLGVIWSLAIEEHFYLLFPPAVALFLLRGGRRGAAFALVALCGLVLAWRCWLTAHGASATYVSMATDTRVDAILAGCLMAVAFNPWLDRRPATPPGRLRDALVVAGSLALLAGTLLVRDETFRATARYTLQSVAILPLLYLAVARADAWPFRWLAWAPLAYLGRVSYTVYLVHQIVLLGLEKHAPTLDPTALGLGAAALTLCIAEPMRRFVERPCATLRRRLHGAAIAARAPRESYAEAR